MKKIAVIIPCFNESATIGKVVSDFRAALPQASVYVFDNNSTDDTGRIAQENGAIVIPSLRQGKGNVVRHMFDCVDADIYLMVDGDGTYPPADGGKLIHLVESGQADMAVGTRLTSFADKSFRWFHQFGNHLISKMIRVLFGVNVTDVLSGYRAFGRDFAKTVPLMSGGFEIETELTLQAVSKDFTIKEIPVSYGRRPQGSHSKLSTVSDGFLILKALFIILKDYKPLLFFSIVSVIFAILSILAGILPIHDYWTQKIVLHVPLAILAAALASLAGISLAIGLILDTLCKYHKENFFIYRKILKNEQK
jgi:glycosyltransferase involved in cell wall biosynthesis